MAAIRGEEALEQPAQNVQEPAESSPNGQDAPSDKREPRFQPQPAVRFKSVVEEINPAAPSQSYTTSGKDEAPGEDGEPGEPTADQLRALSKSLRGCHLQERRMNIFSYQPFSLPASRTASNEDESREASRQGTRSSTSHYSPRLSPRVPDANTPPLTPAGTDHGRDASQHDLLGEHDRRGRMPNIITPRESAHESSSPHRRKPQRPGSSDQVPLRPRSSDGHNLSGDHRKGLFSVGPTVSSSTGSLPVTREPSPAPASAAASQFYTRPFTPVGDTDNPYSASRRQPQSKIEQRFVFPRKKKQASPSASVINLPKVNADKRHSGKISHSNKRDELVQQDSAMSGRGGSMADLKRFFKMGGHHKSKKSGSPASSVRSGMKTPPSSKSTVQIPFGNDHGLASKYGKLGRVLGAGAGGSVRLMRRGEDGVVFAVKEFRPRHSYETEREYVKKLTAEYCIGSSLHHGNIIETLDIVQEKGKWFEVMEYAPFDLFAIVMTGRMSREEISCCFLQILSGVTYLHSMGLAHRDLKLDNVVVSEHGIMKIIDFGSAHVFRYPFENGIVLASGIVGSDPYLAPEVYDERKYDHQAVDIWSLAIIFCCMTLRRFPWKVPRMTDSSFKLFAADPTPGHDPKKLTLPVSRSTNALLDTPPRDMDFESTQKEQAAKSERIAKSEQNESKPNTGSSSTKTDNPTEKKEIIRGPWRILRLLPRESRHIIGLMLEIEPKKRAKMDDILANPWVSDTVICRQIEPDFVVKAADHTHVLEPPAQQK